MVVAVHLPGGYKHESLSSVTQARGRQRQCHGPIGKVGGAITQGLGIVLDLES